VKIKIERSGGFAGISSLNELDSDKLPPSLQNTVKDLLDKKKLSSTKGLGRPKGAADYLNYKITIQDGKKDHVIECNEFDMDSTVKSLISFVQKNSKKD
jgi:hypothetical protein